MIQERIYSYFQRNPQLHVLFIFDRANIIMNDLADCSWGAESIRYLMGSVQKNGDYFYQHVQSGK